MWRWRQDFIESEDLPLQLKSPPPPSLEIVQVYRHVNMDPNTAESVCTLICVGCVARDAPSSQVTLGGLGSCNMVVLELSYSKAQ
jgi:hypothetical protein